MLIFQVVRLFSKQIILHPPEGVFVQVLALRALAVEDGGQLQRSDSNASPGSRQRPKTFFSNDCSPVRQKRAAESPPHRKRTSSGRAEGKLKGRGAACPRWVFHFHVTAPQNWSFRQLFHILSPT